MLTRPPVADDVLRGAFAGLAGEPALLLAVSGGPDSMALMVGAVRWAQALRDPPRLAVATVDHGLRPASRAEADFVAQAAARYGLPHERLPWDGVKPTTRIQERARAARYGLLADYARHLGATHILTAHHADDQAETVLMRLGRGSGIEGLAGMRRTVPLGGGVALTRPLLGFSKAELVAWCDAERLGVVHDPSNDDPSYARVRLRHQRGAADALGLDRRTLLRLAERMSRADRVVAAEADRLAAILPLQRAPSGAATIDCTRMRGLPLELTTRLLPRWLADTAPRGRAPRLEQIERVAAALHEALEANAPWTTTLRGCRLRLTQPGLLSIAPEAPRGRPKPRSDGGAETAGASAPHPQASLGI